MTEPDLRARLRAVFEIDDHPLAFEGADWTERDGLRLGDLRFRAADGEAVRGVLCRPAGREGPLPAVLALHAHGGRYEIGRRELMEGRPALASPLGPALAAAGVQALCLDLPCFGDRAGVAESAAAKAALWRGRSLAGRMLGESRAALDWLAARPDVRADRIALFGLSMGATLAYWLGAVDARPCAVAHLCCFADFAALIALDAHDRHGPYLTVPGLLNLADNGTIAGLIAPRPQFVGLGDRDALTPPAAADPALARLSAAYATFGGRLVVHREPETGHVETPAMRAALSAFLAAALA